MGGDGRRVGPNAGHARGAPEALGAWADRQAHAVLGCWTRVGIARIWVSMFRATALPISLQRRKGSQSHCLALGVTNTQRQGPECEGVHCTRQGVQGGYGMQWHGQLCDPGGACRVVGALRTVHSHLFPHTPYRSQTPQGSHLRAPARVPLPCLTRAPAATWATRWAPCTSRGRRQPSASASRTPRYTKSVRRQGVQGVRRGRGVRPQGAPMVLHGRGPGGDSLNA